MRFNTTFENAIYDWVYSIVPSTTTVIWDKQRIQKKEECITLNIITAGNPEFRADRVGKTTGSGATLVNNDKYETFETISLSVNSYSQSGLYLDNLIKLQRSMNFTDVILMLRKVGLVIRSAGNIIDLTALVDNAYEYRAQCDFKLAYSKVTTNTGNKISRIKGTIMNNIFDVERD